MPLFDGVPVGPGAYDEGVRPQAAPVRVLHAPDRSEGPHGLYNQFKRKAAEDLLVSGARSQSGVVREGFRKK